MRSTFEKVWYKVKERAGIHASVADDDKDIVRLRASVKDILAVGGWLKGGEANFASADDYRAAVAAGVAEIKRLTATNLQGGHASGQWLGASTSGLSAATPNFNTVAKGAFNPVMASMGERCPKCNSIMSAVGLANSKMAVFCVNDRITIPMAPVESSRV
jgi:hypothetical protein